MPRYVIYGAGGVGCLIGAQLHRGGRDVVLIGRGPHGEALSQRGLRLKSPEGTHDLAIPVASGPEEVEFRADDTVILAMKTQDTAAALDRLANAAHSGISLVCAQNGLESERMALRLFDNVYGCLVFVFAAITDPGVVCSYSQSCAGVLELGRYPAGRDQRSIELAEELRQSGFQAEACEDVMAWKRGKLLINLGNPVQAACSDVSELKDLLEGARQEAIDCFDAAGLTCISAGTVMKRGMEALTMGHVDGKPFPGGSTSQDLARGARSSEVDFLNGEITLLGRMVGIDTPINAFLQSLMRQLISDGVKPGSVAATELRCKMQAAASMEA